MSLLLASLRYIPLSIITLLRNPVCQQDKHMNHTLEEAYYGVEWRAIAMSAMDPYELWHNIGDLYLLK